MSSDLSLESQIKFLSEEEKEVTSKILTLFSESNIESCKVRPILEIVETRIHRFVRNTKIKGFYDSIL